MFQVLALISSRGYPPPTQCLSHSFRYISFGLRSSRHYCPETPFETLTCMPVESVAFRISRTHASSHPQFLEKHGHGPTRHRFLGRVTDNLSDAVFDLAVSDAGLVHLVDVWPEGMEGSRLS